MLTLRAGESGQLSAQVNDALGQPIGGATIAFETSDPGVARVTARGLVTSTGAAGSAQIFVASGGRKTSVPVAVAHGTALRILKLSGDSQSSAVRSELKEAISVKAADAYGNPVAGARVLFSTPDGGLPRPAAATTDAAGLARTTWTLGAGLGVQKLSAALEGVPASADLFTASAHAGPPEKLAIIEQPVRPAVVAGAEVVARVRVMDAMGNSTPGVEVEWRAVDTGTGVLPRVSSTDGTGIAEVRVRTAMKAATNRIEARAPGVTQPLEVSIATVAGPPTRVEFAAGARLSARAGHPLRVNPIVRVMDAHGNPVTGVTVRFAVTAGGGTVVNASSMTDGEGLASCGRWTLGAAGENAIEARVAGVAEPTKLVATARRR